MLKEDSLTYKNTKISYYHKGKGRAIIFLHGFMEDKSIWESFIDYYSPKYRVIAIDLLGHGKSGNTGYVHTMQDMAKVVKAVMNQHRLRRVVLVGHSMGGYVSLAFGEKYPDNVIGCCLFHSTAFADTDQKKKDRDRAIKVAQKNQKLFVNETIPNLFFKKDKKLIFAIKKIAIKTSVQSTIAALEGMKRRMDRSVLLKFSPFPYHFIIGKEDAIIPEKMLLEQTTYGKNITYDVIENCGHMGFIEQKNETLESLDRFLKKL